MDVLNTSGTVSFESLRLKICFRGEANASLFSFNNLTVIPSKPVEEPLLVLRFGLLFHVHL